MSKEQQEIFCNILIVFGVTFDQCIVSLLNKSINFFQKHNLVTYDSIDLYKKNDCGICNI